MNGFLPLRFLGSQSVLTAVAVVACAAALSADPPQAAKPSSYAATKDLAAQLEMYVEQIETDLESQADYVDEARQRVEKDAATVAALALVLGMHDEPSPLQESAPAVVAAARKLGASTKDYAAAKQSLAELKQALAASKGDAKLEWRAVADVAQLMKQVPIVNNNLRRGVEGRRFDRSADKNLGYAAALAAIAQAASYDTAYCADKSDEAKWRELSAALRDASAEVAGQVRAKNQPAAVKALDAVEKTCLDCHAAFDVK